MAEHPLKRGLQQILACLDAPGEQDRGAHQALPAFGKELFQVLDLLALRQGHASRCRTVITKYEQARLRGAPALVGSFVVDARARHLLHDEGCLRSGGGRCVAAGSFVWRGVLAGRHQSSGDGLPSSGIGGWRMPTLGVLATVGRNRSRTCRPAGTDPANPPNTSKPACQSSVSCAFPTTRTEHERRWLVAVLHARLHLPTSAPVVADVGDLPPSAKRRLSDCGAPVCYALW